MTAIETIEAKIAEAYGRALAIQDKLIHLVEKCREDSGKKSPKLKQALQALEIEFGLATDSLDQLREEADALLEGGVLANRNVTNMESSIKRLISVKNRLHREEISVEDCKKWVDDLGTIKGGLERRYQIKRVNSEKQASVASLTEQLKNKEELITQLTREKQERDGRIGELTKELQQLRQSPPQTSTSSE